MNGRMNRAFVPTDVNHGQLQGLLQTGPKNTIIVAGALASPGPNYERIMFHPLHDHDLAVRLFNDDSESRGKPKIRADRSSATERKRM
ncbi:hypothetical protein TKK_0012943 [Trichogramma kaykai]